MSTSTPPEYAAVLHILGAPSIVRRTAPYIGADDFDWAGLEREAKTMSGGEALVIRIACELWSAEKLTRLCDIPRRLDDANFERVLEALVLCRGTTSAALVDRLLEEAREGPALAA